MLTKLFGSQARVKLLKIFVLNQDEKFYLRQLSRDLKMQVNSIRRELENLQSFGLLSCDEDSFELEERDRGKTEKKYYHVNQDFVLFPELKALMVKSQVLSNNVFVEKIRATCSPKVFILSGSLVSNPKSQTDILLVGRFNRDKLLPLITELEEDLGRELNYTIMDYREYSYRVDIADFFVYNIIHGKKIVVTDEEKEKEILNQKNKAKK
ncbi:MAG: hypothetical protein PHR57_02480 [Patescibacteria group bacterium]|nr:hypothetical protein [Patescibacteria group bacterium]